MNKESTTKKNSNGTKVTTKEHEEFTKALQGKEQKKEPAKKPDSKIEKKISYLKKIYKKNEGINSDDKRNRFASSLSGSTDDLINGMPSELIDFINEEIEFCLSRDCDPMEVSERVKAMIYLLHLAYKDPRKYLDIYGRNYQELLLSDFISEICDTDYSEEDWHRIARLNFNLNGLRVINNYGTEGHVSGNKLLEMFSEILKNGRTVKALESLGVKVVPSAEGSDNFGWILYGPYDLRLILSVAENLLMQEVQETDISHLIDFSDPRIQEVLKHVNNPTGAEPRLQIMASIGSATLGEVLEDLNLQEDQSYEQISKILMNSMFRIADERAKQFKEMFKRKLKEENLHLYHLYGRSNIEILEERVRELEEEVERLKQK